jgi:hypothetical protein
MDLVVEHLDFTEKDLTKHLLMSPNPDALLEAWVRVVIYKCLCETFAKPPEKPVALIRWYMDVVRAFHALCNSNLPKQA